MIRKKRGTSEISLFKYSLSISSPHKSLYKTISRLLRLNIFHVKLDSSKTLERVKAYSSPKYNQSAYPKNIDCKNPICRLLYHDRNHLYKLHEYYDFFRNAQGNVINHKCALTDKSKVCTNRTDSAKLFMVFK